MSDNKDLKSKILLMRQKNFGEVIDETNEKNDNEKPFNAEINHDETDIETLEDKDKDKDKDEDEVNLNKIQEEIQMDISPNISELKETIFTK